MFPALIIQEQNLALNIDNFFISVTLRIYDWKVFAFTILKTNESLSVASIGTEEWEIQNIENAEVPARYSVNEESYPSTVLLINTVMELLSLWTDAGSTEENTQKKLTRRKKKEEEEKRRSKYKYFHIVYVYLKLNLTIYNAISIVLLN